MHDVARLAGVSIKTVSNVVNGYPYIRPETRAKVEVAISQLGYHVNISGRNLRQKCSASSGISSGRSTSRGSTTRMTWSR